GPRDVAAQKLMTVMRTEWSGGERKQSLDELAAITTIPRRLDEYQRFLLKRAIDRREAGSHRGVEDYGRLREIIEGDGGFVYAGWCGSVDCEDRVKQDTKATIRVVPSEEFRSQTAPRQCAVCGGTSQAEAVWARAY
ncbi:MAG: proline--tRNA ligase, partial [Longimicrobiales bacterium]